MKKVNLSLTLVVLFLTWHPVLRAQGLYGSLLGTITDPSGAVVPNSTIVATSVDTGQTRQTPQTPAGAIRSSIWRLASIV